MDPQDQDPKISAQQEAYKRELYRRSLDKIRVANPTSEDYVVDWDGFKHRIKANSEETVDRYIAEKYVREMKDKLINEMQDSHVKSLKEKMEGQGKADVVWNANEEARRSNKFRTDDPELIKEFYGKLWLGVVEKYGQDVEATDEVAKYDQRPVEQQVLDNLEKPYKAGEPAEVKQSVVDEVADVSA